MKTIKINNEPKQVKYVGNVHMNAEWVSAYKDEDGKHYIWNGGEYIEIDILLFDLWRA